MISLHVTTIIYRSKHDFEFGSFHVRTGGAWLEIRGRLKKTGKDTLYAKLIESNGHGKTCDVRTEVHVAELSGERDRLIDFFNEKI